MRGGNSSNLCSGHFMGKTKCYCLITQFGAREHSCTTLLEVLGEQCPCDPFLLDCLKWWFWSVWFVGIDTIVCRVGMQLRFIHIRQCRGNAPANSSYPNKCLSENSYVFLLYLLVTEGGILFKKKLYNVHTVYLLPNSDIHSLSIGDQRFSSQEDSSKRTSSYPASSAACVHEES